ncbi:MAG: regulatory iron-sulfur-containing complex subunit RicT [Chloroflexota bacterium]|nr:regulatory iron-sulfur-containing complex subunit RicT [Chloroflexota bacterium]
MTEQLIEQIAATVAGVRFHRVGKVYHFDYSEYPQLQVGDHVIVETARGRQMGEIVSFNAVESGDQQHKPIMRIATPRDLVLKHHWELQQDDAMRRLREKVDEFGGYDNIKFVSAVYNYDGTMLTYLYTTEDKVNLNRLHNDLRRQFTAQVEFRQIGPRDVAKLLGGFGACGELRCCSTFLTDFSPISIKMAKMQGVSLNPSEITGMCGRLRCCLVYEYENYVEARSKLPKKNKRVGTPHGEGKVLDVLPLQDAVLVQLEESRMIVPRAELVPLDELEALARKAKAPCDKHGDGPCECGAKPGKAATADAPAAELSADAPAASLDQSGVDPAPDRPPRAERRNRTDRQGRRGGRANKKPGDAADSTPGTESNEPPANE